MLGSMTPSEEARKFLDAKDEIEYFLKNGALWSCEALERVAVALSTVAIVSDLVAGHVLG